MTGVREEKIQARVCLTALSVKYRCRCHVAMITGVRYEKIRIRVCLTVGTNCGVRMSPIWLLLACAIKYAI